MHEERCEKCGRDMGYREVREGNYRLAAGEMVALLCNPCVSEVTLAVDSSDLWKRHTQLEQERIYYQMLVQSHESQVNEANKAKILELTEELRQTRIKLWHFCRALIPVKTAESVST